MQNKITRTKIRASKILTLLLCILIFIDHDAKFRSIENVRIHLVLTFLISLLCFFVIPSYKKFSIFPFYIYILFLYFNVSLTLLYTGNQSIQRILYILQGVFLGVALLKNDLSYSIVKIFVYSFVIFYFYQIFSGVNRVSFFAKGSQNGLTVHLLLLIVIYYISQWQNNLKYDIIPSFLFILIAAWAKGRTGFIASVLLFLLVFSQSLWSIKRKYLKFLYICFICIIMTIFIYIILSKYILYETFISPIFSRFYSEGIESPRSLIWGEYFFEMGENIYNIIFGVPYRNVPILRQYNNNPHNSFIYMHSQYGLVITLMNVVLIIVSFYRYLKTDRFLLGLFIILLLRAFTDIIAFPGIFDGVIYYFIFFPFSKQSLINRSFQSLAN